MCVLEQYWESKLNLTFLPALGLCSFTRVWLNVICKESEKMKKRNHPFLSSFHHFGVRIDPPHNCLSSLSLFYFYLPAPHTPLLSLSLSPLLSLSLSRAVSPSPPSQPLLQEMACTLGLFSNYSSTFSEKVIIIRDPFSLFLWKAWNFFFSWPWYMRSNRNRGVGRRRRKKNKMPQSWSEVVLLSWLAGQVACINGSTLGQHWPFAHY